MSWIVTSWVKTISGVYKSFAGISHCQILPTKFAFYEKPAFNLVSLDKKSWPKKDKKKNWIQYAWKLICLTVLTYLNFLDYFLNFVLFATLKRGEHPLLKSWHSTVVLNALQFWHPRFSSLKLFYLICTGITMVHSQTTTNNTLRGRLTLTA